MQSPPVTLVSPTRPSLRSSLSLQRPRMPQLATQQQRRRQACALAQVDANGAGAVAQRPESVRSSRPHATMSADEDAARSAMTGTLLVKCPDAKGVVASVAQVRARGSSVAVRRTDIVTTRVFPCLLDQS